MDMGEDKLPDNRDLDTEGGNYNENIKGDYIQGNKGDAIEQNSSSFGVNVNKGNINAQNVGRTINENIRGNYIETQHVTIIEGDRINNYVIEQNKNSFEIGETSQETTHKSI